VGSEKCLTGGVDGGVTVKKNTPAPKRKRVEVGTLRKEGGMGTSKAKNWPH